MCWNKAWKNPMMSSSKHLFLVTNFGLLDGSSGLVGVQLYTGGHICSYIDFVGLIHYVLLAQTEATEGIYFFCTWFLMLQPAIPDFYHGSWVGIQEQGDRRLHNYLRHMFRTNMLSLLLHFFLQSQTRLRNGERDYTSDGRCCKIILQ